MKASIHDQIHDYASDVISHSVAVEIDEIRERQPTPEPVRPVPAASLPAKAQARPWLVAMASAAAVLVLIGGVGLVFQMGGSDSPPATTPETVSLSLSGWSRVPGNEATFGGPGEQ
jgi:hypothetical protein